MIGAESATPAKNSGQAGAEKVLLRPLSLGELLDQAIRLYRRNFWTVIAIALVVQLPLVIWGLVSYWLNPASFTGEVSTRQPTTLEIGLSYLAGYLFWLLLYEGVGLGALVQAFASAFQHGPIRFIESFRRFGRVWLRLMIVLVATVFVDVAIAVWTVVPIVGWVTGLGILFYFLLVVVPLLAPVIVVERHGVLRSIARTWELTRRSFWWALLAMAVLFLFNQVIFVGPVAVVGGLVAILLGPTTSPDLSRLVQLIISEFLDLTLLALYLPLLAAGITLIYFQLRVRAEGLDLILSSGGSVEDDAPAPSLRPLVQLKDFGRYALLSVGAVLFVVVVFVALELPLIMMSLVSQAWPQ